MGLKLANPNVKADKINKIIALAEIIKRELEHEILGKKLPGWKCNCSAHSCDEAAAIGISYPLINREEILSPILWNVQMRSLNNKSNNPMDYDYSIGLNSFIDQEVIDRIFKFYKIII